MRDGILRPSNLETSCSPLSRKTPPLPMCTVPLASLEGATGLLSDAVVDNTMGCTATEKRACQIVHYLSAWNELLAPAEVEVQETPQTHVGLTIKSIRTPYPVEQGPEALHKAFTLLHCLVKMHRCIRAVDLVIQRLRPYHALLCEALDGNDYIESVTFRDFTPECLGYCKLFLILPSLKKLKTFKCRSGRLPQPCSDSLAALLRKTKTLESLHISGGWKESAAPSEFLIELAAYPSLRELSLHLGILDRVPIECCEVFARYLKNTSTIVALSFPWEGYRAAESRKAILKGLRANKSILKLDMELGGDVDDEAVDLIATIFTENIHLRSFKISPRTARFNFGRGRYCDSWLKALAENDTLEELTLPCNIWRPQQWRTFLEMLSLKHTLKSVIIGWHDFKTSLFHLLCQAILEIGVEAKVTFSRHICASSFISDFTTLRCKSVTAIYAFKDLDEETMEIPHLQTFMCELTRLNHVTDVSLDIHPHASNKDLSSAIAGYITATTALKKLVLQFRAGADIDEGTNMYWNVIIESLSRNRSIATLVITTKYMATEDMEYLSQVLRCSQNIREVSCGWGRQDPFIQHLSKGIAMNYSLVRVTCFTVLDRHAFAVMDTVRRNSSLVARASHFRQGAELERVTAAAIERVHMHRALLEEFADVESISVDEASSTPKSALRASKDMHGFMRLAGVVRASVECHPRQDGRAQLDDLNDLCWAALRRYLLIEDVAPTTTARVTAALMSSE